MSAENDFEKSPEKKTGYDPTPTPTPAKEKEENVAKSDTKREADNLQQEVTGS